MEKMKNPMDRYLDEVLTDNTKIEKYRACKTCKYRDKAKMGERKSVCGIYVEEYKPLSIMNNGDCDWYEKG